MAELRVGGNDPFACGKLPETARDSADAARRFRAEISLARRLATRTSAPVTSTARLHWRSSMMQVHEPPRLDDPAIPTAMATTLVEALAKNPVDRFARREGPQLPASTNGVGPGA